MDFLRAKEADDFFGHADGLQEGATMVIAMCTSRYKARAVSLTPGEVYVQPGSARLHNVDATETEQNHRRRYAPEVHYVSANYGGDLRGVGRVHWRRAAVAGCIRACAVAVGCAPVAEDAPARRTPRAHWLWRARTRARARLPHHSPPTVDGRTVPVYVFAGTTRARRLRGVSGGLSEDVSEDAVDVSWDVSEEAVDVSWDVSWDVSGVRVGGRVMGRVGRTCRAEQPEDVSGRSAS